MDVTIVANSYSAGRKYLNNGFLNSIVICNGIDFPSYAAHTEKRTLRVLKTFFHIIAIMIIIECIVSNTVDANIVRNFYNMVLGTSERAYEMADARFGFVGAFAMFAEPSYVALFVVYFGILFIEGIPSGEMKYFIMSILAVVMSSSTSALATLVIPIIIIIRDYTPILKVNIKRIVVFIFLTVGIVVAYLVIARKFSNIIELVQFQVIRRISSFLDLGDATFTGSCRRFGNALCYTVFSQSPLFGIGIGTTRSYSLISGMLACYGLLGTLAIFVLYINILDVRFSKRKGLYISMILLYSIALFSVFYTYSLLFAFLLLPLISSDVMQN